MWEFWGSLAAFYEFYELRPTSRCPELTVTYCLHCTNFEELSTVRNQERKIHNYTVYPVSTVRKDLSGSEGFELNPIIKIPGEAARVII